MLPFGEQPAMEFPAPAKSAPGALVLATSRTYARHSRSTSSWYACLVLRMPVGPAAKQPPSIRSRRQLVGGELIWPARESALGANDERRSDLRETALSWSVRQGQVHAAALRVREE